jgi:hypothetical protein
MADKVKRAVSFAIFGIGILLSLFGCVGYAGTMFGVGVNDSPQEVLAITFALATPLPACVLALWHRLIAGVWLIFAGCFFTYGMVAQRAYMIHMRHFPNQPTIRQEIKASLPLSLILIGFGLFAVITHLLKWPKLWRSFHVSDPTLGRPVSREWWRSSSSDRT